MLYECHGHMMLDGMSYNSAVARHGRGVNEAALRANFEELRSRGITYFREGGDTLGVSLRAAQLAGEYGISYASPVFAIHRAGYYGSIVGRAYNTPAEYKELVSLAARQGAGFIKLMYSGLNDFNNFGRVTDSSIEPGEIKMLVHIAHEEGFRVMAHVNGAAAIRAALEAGTDSIEHGCYMDTAGLSILKERGAVWVPTLAALESFTNRKGFDAAVSQRILEVQLEAVAAAVSMGALVASGSDSGAVGVPHGAGLEAELELLQKACGPGATAAVARANDAVRERFRRQ